MLAVSVVGLAAIGLVGYQTTDPVPAAFSTVAAPWMPSAPSSGTLTSTWFCPGVPAGGEEGTGGEIVIANAGATPM
ncbi:MAG: hypothetical protein ABW219_04175, partial [Ilumatobacteraceae bacterium]